MRKDMIVKALVLGVICLFIGVGVQPAFAVESRVSADNLEQVEDCDCQTDVSDVEHIRLDKTLDGLDSYSKILLLLSKINPEIAEKCDEFSNDISTLRGMIDNLKNTLSNILICFALIAVMLTYIGLSDFVENCIHYFEGTILEPIFRVIYNRIGVKYYDVLDIYFAFDCDELPGKLQL